jgi:hypothetical protein
MTKKKVNINRIIYIVAAAAVAALLMYYIASFFYYPECQNEACFKEQLWKCNKASFLHISENSTWQYNINGFSGEQCAVYAKAVSLKTDDVTGAALSGKDMTCYIPKSILGAFMPEEKIEYCHGVLKEEIQRLMIEKMHLYIVQNIGKINQSSFGAI